MKAYVAVQKKILVMIYTLWKKDEVFNIDNKNTSGNDEPRALFPLTENDNESVMIEEKIVMPQLSGITQVEPRYKESPEALFP